MVMLRYTNMERRTDPERSNTCTCYTRQAACHAGLRSVLGVPQQYSEMTGGFSMSSIPPFKWFIPTHQSRFSLLVLMFQTIACQQRHIDELREEIVRYVAADQRRRIADSEQRRGD